jgi:hypothetical protein
MVRLPSNIGFELFQRPVQMGFHRTYRSIQYLGNLTVGQIMQVFENDHRFVGFGKLVNRFSFPMERKA